MTLDQKIKKFAKSDKEIVEYRRNAKILVIDDKPFPQKDNLEASGYILRVVQDLLTIESVASFDIIVCDIRNVGKQFGSKYEGVYLMQEIRNLFPEKYIIAFSASTFDLEYTQLLRITDTHLKKDLDIHEWSLALDQAIRTMYCPFSRWSRTKTMLVGLDVPLNEIESLGKQYLKSLISGTAPSLKVRKLTVSNPVNANQAMSVVTSLFNLATAVARFGGV